MHVGGEALEPQRLLQRPGQARPVVALRHLELERVGLLLVLDVQHRVGRAVELEVAAADLAGALDGQAVDVRSFLLLRIHVQADIDLARRVAVDDLTLPHDQLADGEIGRCVGRRLVRVAELPVAAPLLVLFQNDAGRAPRSTQQHVEPPGQQGATGR